MSAVGSSSPAPNPSTPFNAEKVRDFVTKSVVSPIVNLGIAGFEFDIAEEHKSELTAEITDHFVEDNSTIQDHISIKPEKLTLRGFIGELTDIRSTAKTVVIELFEKLTIVAGLLPVLDNAATQSQRLIEESKKDDGVDFLKDEVGTGVDIFQAIKQLIPPSTNQERGYRFFKALFEAKQLVAVDTPFGFFSAMAIENVVATQSDNAFTSDFTVTLKKFRTAKTKLVEFDEEKSSQGRQGNQKAEPKIIGQVAGSKEFSSTAFDAFDALRGN